MRSIPRATELAPSTASFKRRSIALALVCVIVTLAGCGSDTPTGVADRQVSRLKPRGEYWGCVQPGQTPPDTVAIPIGGDCPSGFDTVIWY